MVRSWFRKPKAAVFTPLLLALLLAVACGGAAKPTSVPTIAPVSTTAPGATTAPATRPTPTAAPAGQVKAKVNRLIIGVDPAAGETNLVWGGSVDHHQQLELVMEVLIDIDPETNGYVPELANKWEMSPDAKAWTFWLNKGVQFHDNWGEFTAKDVVHSVAMVQREDSILGYSTAFRQIAQVEVVNDYQVVLRLKNPDPDYDFYVAPSGGLLMQSKAFWDAKGDQGYQDKAIGTGPYRYTGRTLGVNVTFERLPQHWRVKQTDWPEFEIRWMKEPVGRQAALLAREIHIAELTRELLDSAVSRQGMKLIRSRHPANQISGIFEGLYPTDPAKYNPQLPYTNIKVRQAMNKAINKKEIAKTLFSDRVTISPVLGYYPNLPGWNAAWLEKFDNLYGFDPEGAKKLLAEAGYPNGFQIKGILVSIFGFPEAVDLIQAVQVQFRAVGIDMKLEEWEFPRWLAAFRSKDPASHAIWFSPPSYKTVSAQIGLFNYSQGPIHFFETEWLDTKYEQLQQTVDPAKRDPLLREMGDYLFDQFAYLPLFYYFIEFGVNPEIVDDWPFPGSDGANYGHFDLIKACTKPAPCR